MAMLTGLEIKKRLGSDIIIEPFNENQLNPNSYNLRLHDKLLVYHDNNLDMKKDNPVREITIPEKGLWLYPGELYLGRTVEYTETNNLVPGLDGRSSIGRLGINVHATAGFGDDGFYGFWTLEVSVVKPIKIYPNIEICQIYYHDIIGERKPYQGKYQNNDKIQSSMLFREFK